MIQRLFAVSVGNGQSLTTHIVSGHFELYKIDMLRTFYDICWNNSIYWTETFAFSALNYYTEMITFSQRNHLYFVKWMDIMQLYI